MTLKDVKATGAMTVLLKDALQPNLVQTLEGNPALIHGGPFANIAHGCNSVIATQAGLRLADYTVTEAGFGADLGAEKFLGIKCRQAGLAPSAVVIVATVRALKMHGGVDKTALGAEDVAALEAGFSNLARHVGNLRGFGLPVVVAVNHFHADTEAEHAALRRLCRDRLDVEAILCRHWAEGGAGAETLAQAVVDLAAGAPAPLRHIYESEASLAEKIRAVATKFYGAADIRIEPKAAAKLAAFERGGLRVAPRLHGQDAVFVLHRSDPHGCAGRARGRRARRAPLGRRRLRRGDLRGNHDHARPAARTGGGFHPAGRGRSDRGIVLTHCPSSDPR